MRPRPWGRRARPCLTLCPSAASGMSGRSPTTPSGACGCAKGCPASAVPLQNGATRDGWGRRVAVSSAVALGQVRRTDVADGGSREFFRRLIRPAKLLLSLAINFHGIDHGDACWIHRGPNYNRHEKPLGSTLSDGRHHPLQSRPDWCGPSHLDSLCSPGRAEPTDRQRLGSWTTAEQP